MLTTYHFRVLDVGVALRGPEEVLGPVACAYRRFLVQGPAPDGIHEIRLESAEADSFMDGSNPVPIIAGANLTLQIYERFLNALFDRVSACAVLHAGALVDARGEALLIAGASGFGKTSLTLELVCRGLGFLSDDYAPIDLSTGMVQPYPRTVGLLADGAARTPQCFVDAAANSPASSRLLGKALIDVGAVLGEAAIATKPVPVGHVVLLDAGASESTYRSVVHVGVWPRGVVEAAALLQEMPGVEVLGRSDRDDITVWRVELHHEQLLVQRFSELLEREFVAFSETRPSAGPDFRSEPRLTPLKRREVALLLCREVQNRRPRGRLMQAYEGDTTRLFLDVAASLASARCFRLEVGNFESTAKLLEELAR